MEEKALNEKSLYNDNIINFQRYINRAYAKKILNLTIKLSLAKLDGIITLFLLIYFFINNNNYKNITDLLILLFSQKLNIF